MNREILFRAKRKGVIDDTFYRSKYKNGDWVYGLITKQYSKEFEDKLNDEMIDIHGISGIEIDRNTIGQYTGIKDKNWKKIFEGDILKIISSVKGEIVGNTRTFKSVEREDCAVVLWNYKTGGYKLKVYHNGKYKRISKFTIGHLWVYKAEVIGNIYDNPELLCEK